jgi:hypothetical protein
MSYSKTKITSIDTKVVSSNPLPFPWPLQVFTYKINGNMISIILFNATFNNNSVISWRTVSLVEKTTDLSQITDNFYHIMLNTATFLCMSQARSWISEVIFRGLFRVQWREMIARFVDSNGSVDKHCLTV